MESNTLKKPIDKSEKKVAIKNNILTFTPIFLTFILTNFIISNVGYIFIILISLLCFLTIEDPFSYIYRFFYFLGVASIVSLYVYRNNYITALILLIILGIIITFEILESKNKNKDKDKELKFRDNLKCFLIGLLITSLILIWKERSKN